MIEKYCPGCDTSKSTEDFFKCRTKCDGLQSYCKLCMKRRNEECVKRTGRKRKKQPYEKTKAATVRYLARHPERRKAIMRSWRTRNAECIREYDRQRRENNPESIDAKNSAYMERKRKAEGWYTPAEWQEKCAEYCFRCAYCWKRKKLTRQHVIPLKKGGTNWIFNLVPACQSCNSKVGTKIVWPDLGGQICLSSVD